MGATGKQDRFLPPVYNDAVHAVQEPVGDVPRNSLRLFNFQLEPFFQLEEAGDRAVRSQVLTDARDDIKVMFFRVSVVDAGRKDAMIH